MWKSCNSLLRMRSKSWRNKLLTQKIFVTEIKASQLYI
jgi:hypothetical protein